MSYEDSKSKTLFTLDLPSSEGNLTSFCVKQFRYSVEPSFDLLLNVKKSVESQTFKLKLEPRVEKLKETILFIKDMKQQMDKSSFSTEFVVLMPKFQFEPSVEKVDGQDQVILKYSGRHKLNLNNNFLLIN